MAKFYIRTILETARLYEVDAASEDEAKAKFDADHSATYFRSQYGVRREYVEAVSVDRAAVEL